jgi:hypothetical protein
MGVAAARAGDPTTLAHELGHALGRLHTPCGPIGTGAFSVDPNYPTYDAYPSASIGKVGFDIESSKSLFCKDQAALASRLKMSRIIATFIRHSLV